MINNQHLVDLLQACVNVLSDLINEEDTNKSMEEEEDCGGYRGDGGNDPDNYPVTKYITFDVYPNSGLPDTKLVPSLIWGKWNPSKLCFEGCRITKANYLYLSIFCPECKIRLH